MNRLGATCSTPGGVGQSPVSFAYAYNDANQRVRTRLADGNFWLYEYDDLNRLTDLEHRAANNTLLASYHYELHPTGRRSGATETLLREEGGYATSTFTWDYDKQYRLRFETSTSTASELVFATEYRYDKVGNRKKKIRGNQTIDYSYNDNDQLTGETSSVSGTTTTTDYGYDANHRLTRRWTPAKGETFYTNDAVGNLIYINYPSSPDIILQYDPLNRLTNLVDGVGTTRYSYTAAGQVLSEDGPWANDTVSYSYDNRRRSGLSLQQPNASAWEASYGYDAANRLANVTSPAGAFGYAYDAVRHQQVQKLTLPGGAYITNDYDSVARLLGTALKNAQHSTLNSHQYQYNAGNQRTKQSFTAGNTVDYTYDDIGQLKTATGRESNDAERLHEKFGYFYDAAWNLNRRTNNALVQEFDVNNLNQLTSLGRSGTLTVAGTTTSEATDVTVNDLSAERYADRTFARGGFSLANGLNTFTAIAEDSFGRRDTNSVSVNLPATVNLLYDLNGNMRTNGSRILEYDDENQLVRITEPMKWKSEFTYDGKLRCRIEKNFGWQGGAWVQTNEVRFVYDGNVPIQHRDGNNLPTLTWTRGPDLSGSFQGAGGIGGLLAMTENSAIKADHSYFHADGNGNVTCLINANQIIVGRYLYDPFGNTLSISGPKAFANRYRFSSKPIHELSGLYDFLYRRYDPILQRWPNRDPLEELGFQELLGATEVADSESHLDEGHNLYTFVGNNPMNKVDPLGLAALDFPPIGCDVKVTCGCRFKIGISWDGPEMTVVDTESGETWKAKVDARNGVKVDVGPCTVRVRCFFNVDFDKADECYAKCRKKCGSGLNTFASKCRTRCFNNCVKKR